LGELKEKIHHVGRESYFVNDNAALDDTRQAVQELARRMVDPPGTCECSCIRWRSAPAGIAANAILAGVTDTNALRQIPGYEKSMEVARQRNANRRLTQPEDVARCIAALCHPATYWLTGNTLHLDGGENIVG
jgi:Enoyl-(Acyl carrier protein) reductase